MCNSRIDGDIDAAINLSSLTAGSAEGLIACLRLEVAAAGQCPHVIQEINAISSGISG